MRVARNVMLMLSFPFIHAGKSLFRITLAVSSLFLELILALWLDLDW